MNARLPRSPSKMSAIAMKFTRASSRHSSKPRLGADSMTRLIVPVASRVNATHNTSRNTTASTSNDAPESSIESLLNDQSSMRERITQMASRFSTRKKSHVNETNEKQNST